MKRRFSLGLDRYSGLHLFVVFLIIFGIWAPHTFLTLDTVHLIASQEAPAAMVALALLVPMVAGQFDLAVGAIANLSAMVAVELQLKQGWAPVPALIAAVVVGVAVGAVSGFVVVKMGVDSFIATLGIGSVVAGVQTIITGGVTPPPVASNFWSNMTQYTVGGFQIILFYLIVIAIILWWVLGHTPAGRFMYATGSNREAARLSGIQTGRWSWIALMASGGISALAGCLYVSLTGPTLSFGATLLLPSFAAVFLGSTQLVPGKFNVWGTLLAIIVLAVGAQGLQLVSGIQWTQDVFNGLALILAVALSVKRQSSAGWWRAHFARWRGMSNFLRSTPAQQPAAADRIGPDQDAAQPDSIERGAEVRP